MFPGKGLRQDLVDGGLMSAVRAASVRAYLWHYLRPLGAGQALLYCTY